MKFRMLMTALLAVLLIPMALQAQMPTDNEIIVKSCDGDIRISELCLEFRDYVLVVESAADGLVQFRDHDANVTATLDLRKKSCFCLNVVEDGLEMKVHCCWENVMVPAHADIWNTLTDHDRAFFSRTAMHKSLLASLHREI